MHSYSTDTGERTQAYLIFTSAAVLVASGFAFLATVAPASFTQYLPTPSAVAIVGVLYKIFDQFLWHHIASAAKFGEHCLIRTPDLRGNWQGTLRPDGDTPDLRFKAKITQTWTKILIELEFERSRSTSLSCSMITTSSTDPTMVYHYINKPHPEFRKTQSIHFGTTELHMRGPRLEGHYYNGPARGTRGTLELCREETASPEASGAEEAEHVDP